MNDIVKRKEKISVKPTKANTIPIENMIALAEKGLSHKQIGEVVGCGENNVQRRLAPYRNQLTSIKDFVSARAVSLQVLQKMLLDGITEKEIKKMSVKQRVDTFNILYEKERLERGLSTSNEEKHTFIWQGEAEQKQVEKGE